MAVRAYCWALSRCLLALLVIRPFDVLLRTVLYRACKAEKRAQGLPLFQWTKGLQKKGGGLETAAFFHAQLRLALVRQPLEELPEL